MNVKIGIRSKLRQKISKMKKQKLTAIKFDDQKKNSLSIDCMKSFIFKDF